MTRQLNAFPDRRLATCHYRKAHGFNKSNSTYKEQSDCSVNAVVFGDREQLIVIRKYLNDTEVRDPALSL